MISSQSALQPGDIVYFDYNPANGLSYIDHAGVYVGGGNVLSAVSEKYGIGTHSISWYGAGGLHFVGGVRHWSDSGTPSDGTLVSYQGNVYRIASGAPIYVSSWAVFGGPQPTQALSDSQWAALRQYPADRTGLCGQEAGGGGGAFVVAGGAPIWISSFNNISPNPCVPVDQAAIDNAGDASITPSLAHLRFYPADGTFLSGSLAETSTGWPAARRWPSLTAPHWAAARRPSAWIRWPSPRPAEAQHHRRACSQARIGRSAPDSAAQPDRARLRSQSPTPASPPTRRLQPARAAAQEDPAGAAAQEDPALRAADPRAAPRPAR